MANFGNSGYTLRRIRHRFFNISSLKIKDADSNFGHLRFFNSLLYNVHPFVKYKIKN